jgi:predicted kinase
MFVIKIQTPVWKIVNKNTFTESKKIPCVFARLWYSLSMKENEKEIAKITAQLEQVAEDLLDPMLDDQTTVLINHMGKLRKKIAELEK